MSDERTKRAYLDGAGQVAWKGPVQDVYGPTIHDPWYLGPWVRDALGEFLEFRVEVLPLPRLYGRHVEALWRHGMRLFFLPDIDERCPDYAALPGCWVAFEIAVVPNDDLPDELSQLFRGQRSPIMPASPAVTRFVSDFFAWLRTHRGETKLPDLRLDDGRARTTIEFHPIEKDPFALRGRL